MTANAGLSGAIVAPIGCRFRGARSAPGRACAPGATTAPAAAGTASQGASITRTAATPRSRAHHHAAQHGITRLILDVLPARTDVISFYRHVGYTDAEPYATESPVPMIYMQRIITSEDRPIRRS
jgi:hypothetical protein